MEEKNKIKKNRQRSSGYPAIDLGLAIQLVTKLNGQLGAGYVSRDMAANALGYKGLSGSAARSVASLVHYGLLERKGKSYKISSLARAILFPVSDDSKNDAIYQAFLTPKLFKFIYDQYVGENLPGLLKNILIQNHNINPSVSEEVANTFKKSASFSGVLDDDNILIEQTKGMEIKMETETPVIGDTKNDKEKIDGKPVSEQAKASEGGTSVPLSGGVIMTFPQEYILNLAMGDFKESIDMFNTTIRAIMKSTLTNNTNMEG